MRFSTRVKDFPLSLGPQSPPSRLVGSVSTPLACVSLVLIIQRLVSSFFVYPPPPDYWFAFLAPFPFTVDRTSECLHHLAPSQPQWRKRPLLSSRALSKRLKALTSHCTMARQDTCTQVTPSCPVSATTLGYYPNKPLNIFLCAAFGIAALLTLIFGVWKKTWSYMAFIVAGSVLELAGRWDLLLRPGVAFEI